MVMPNPEQCGFRSRRSTAFAHASCFEKDVKESYRLELQHQAELQREIVEARTALSPCHPDSDPAGACLAGSDLSCPVHGEFRRKEIA
jgi:hypothetical protein